MEWTLLELQAKTGIKGHLPPVSRQSSLSTNRKSDNEMIPEAVHISPGIYLTGDENSGKSQLGDHR